MSEETPLENRLASTKGVYGAADMKCDARGTTCVSQKIEENRPWADFKALTNIRLWKR